MLLLPSLLTPAGSSDIMPTLNPAPSTSDVILLRPSHKRRNLSSAQHRTHHTADQNNPFPSTPSHSLTQASVARSARDGNSPSQPDLQTKPPHRHPTYLGFGCGFWAKLGVAWCFAGRRRRTRKYARKRMEAAISLGALCPGTGEKRARTLRRHSW